MDSLTIIISIIALISCFGIYFLIVNPNLSWKTISVVSIIIAIILIDLHILFTKIDELHIYLIQNQIILYIILALGFLLSGLYALMKSTSGNKSLETNKTNPRSDLRKLLDPMAIFLMFFISLSVLQIDNDKTPIYLIIILVVTFLIIINLVLTFSTSLKQVFLSWELLGITSTGAGLYLIFSFLMPGDFASQAELFAPDNSGMETQYIILIAVTFIIVFSTGFFFKPPKQGHKK